MGQAAVDLPDSPLSDDDALHTPAPTKGSADELLAELAGDEIDRLLAEADVDHSPRQESAANSPAESATPATTRPTVVIPSGQAPRSAAPVSSSPAAPELDAQIDQLFTELGQGAQATPPASAEANSATSIAANPATPSESSSLPSEEGALSPLEKAQLDLSEVLDALPSIAATGGRLHTEGEEAPLPLLLRPLAWINAPLAYLPPAARDIMGKAAIVTIVNAMAVILYVLIFRGR